jgi:hypothetical protein
MKVYTFSEARQRFARVLEEARRAGSVRIRRNDGLLFVVRPEQANESPLDVKGVQLDLCRDEIVAAVRERRRG